MPGTLKPRNGNKTLAVAGAKGGAGGTFCSVQLALELARKHQVILAESPGRSGSHAYFGKPKPQLTVEKFFQGEDVPLNECITSHEGSPVSWLSAVGSGPLPEGPLPPDRWKKYVRELGKLPCDFLVFDLPSGVSGQGVYGFAQSDCPILVSTPTPPAMESAFDFLKNAVYYLVRQQCKQNPTAEAFLQDAFDSSQQTQLDTLEKMLEGVAGLDVELAGQADTAVKGFQPSILINQIKRPEDEEVVEPLRSLCRKYLSLEVLHLGSLPFDAEVENSLLQEQPYLAQHSESPLAKALAEAAEKLS